MKTAEEIKTQVANKLGFSTMVDFLNSLSINTDEVCEIDKMIDSVSDLYATSQTEAKDREIEGLKKELQKYHVCDESMEVNFPKRLCTFCDGCGRYEGGVTLQTKCEVCDGTGYVKDTI